MFKVVLKKSAEKFLFKLDEKIRKKIIEILKTLESNSLPFNLYDVIKLKGYKNHFRIRAGKIRTVYEFVPKEQTIIVWDIDFREKIY